MDFAYDGEEMAISSEGFPCLKILIIRDMICLKNIRVKKGGGMSSLGRLEIYKCPCQNRLPEELRLIATTMNDCVHVPTLLRGVDNRLHISICIHNTLLTTFRLHFGDRMENSHRKRKQMKIKKLNGKEYLLTNEDKAASSPISTKISSSPFLQMNPNPSTNRDLRTKT
ncbi:hypothetical protein ABFS83_06G196800 [Erythranthe nasuta]